MRRLTITFYFFILAHLIYGAPFKFLETKVTQPDGTELLLYASGDEYFHWVHDKDGYTILLGEDGYCYYAQKDENGILIPSSHRVNEGLPENEKIKPWIKISEKEYLQRVEKWQQPIEKTPIRAANESNLHRSTLNNIVIFISFPDAQTFSRRRSVYDSRFNSTTSSSGSMKDYYLEASYNNIMIESTFFPEADLDADNVGYVDFNERGFYKPYNATTNKDGYKTETERTNREHNLLVNAIDAMRNSIEETFTPEEIDANNDGYIDNICFVIQGNSDGWSDLLWAHRWSLYTRLCYIHGKRVLDYVFQPENQVTINTLCHEMFHALGAPDLYHYRENSQHLDPVGEWDLMGSGWCHMGAYMKWEYAQQSWITEIPEITTSGTYSIKPLIYGPDNVCYKVKSSNPNEYYVLEYRKKEGKYEGNLRRSGLLIYRINTTVREGNRNGPPDEVYIYRPFGSLVENGFLDEAVYQTTSGPVITDITFPKPFLSDNTDGGLRIGNLLVEADQLTFDISITATGIEPSPSTKRMNIYMEVNTLFLNPGENVREVVLTDLSGIIVCRKVGNIQTLSLDNLSKGVYIVSAIHTDGFKTVEKIIVK